MAYVKRHPTNDLKRSIDYIKNKSKTDELLTYENLLPSSDTNEIVAMMNQTKDAFKKSGGIQGHHFIQSFKSDEDKLRGRNADSGKCVLESMSDEQPVFGP